MDRMPTADPKPGKKPWGLREHDEEIERLRYVERLTLEAIAKRIGCSKQAISGALARQAMKKALAAATGEGSTTISEVPETATGLIIHPSAQSGAEPQTEEV